MISRIKGGVTSLHNRPASVYQSIDLTVLRPRLWMVLLVLFFPFFVICAHYFEALERTGTVGAIVADTFFQPAIVGYIAILWILKKRKI